MVENQTITTIAAVATAVGVTLTLLNNIFQVFINDVSTIGAVILAAMGLMLFAVLVLSIDNRRKMNEITGDEP